MRYATVAVLSAVGVVAGLGLAALLFVGRGTQTVVVDLRPGVAVAVGQAGDRGEQRQSMNGGDADRAPSAQTTEPVRTLSAAPTRSPAAERAPVSAAAATQTVDRALARFRDATVPIETREAEIRALAQEASPRAVAILMALGDEDTYLNRAAVEALGGVRQPDVAEYLRAKLAAPDPRVIAAAMRALAALDGEGAVDAIAAAMARDRRRADGHEDIVLGAGVAALESTVSPRAVGPLVAELGATAGKTLNHDFGSQVVAALRRIGAGTARAGLASYADRLTAERAAMADNPMGQAYLAAKIEEARAAAAALTRE